jgi:hypothetical protein
MPEDRTHLITELSPAASSEFQRPALLDLDTSDVADLIAAPFGYDVVLQVALVDLLRLPALAVGALLRKLLQAVMLDESGEGLGAGQPQKALLIHRHLE